MSQIIIQKKSKKYFLLFTQNFFPYQLSFVIAERHQLFREMK